MKKEEPLLDKNIRKDTVTKIILEYYITLYFTHYFTLQFDYVYRTQPI